MPAFRPSLVAAALLITSALPLSAQAESFVSYAASESVGMSFGASSNSISRSSDASSGRRHRDHFRAEGDYKLLELAAAEDRPGMARLKLQATTDRGEDNEFVLYVPQTVVQRTGLAAGQLVQAQARPYGVAFAQGQPRQPFFLVIDDAVQRELQTQPVTL
jgi:hypothetical protein